MSRGLHKALNTVLPMRLRASLHNTSRHGVRQAVVVPMLDVQGVV